MTYKQTTVLLLPILFMSILIVASCKKDKEAEGTDKQLYDMAKVTSGFTWYKNSSVLLDKSSGSGHSFPFLRTRFNTIASAQLDSIGKVMTDAAFPDGSLIVKELYEDASTLGRYAVLYKSTGHADADANGWVWGYINEDGTVAVPASEKGSQCIGCHSQEGSIDYILMNKFFP
jgi:hypothetical protein